MGIEGQARTEALKWAGGEIMRGRQVSPAALAMVYGIELARLEGRPYPKTVFVRDKFEVCTDVIGAVTCHTL